MKKRLHIFIAVAATAAAGLMSQFAVAQGLGNLPSVNSNAQRTRSGSECVPQYTDVKTVNDYFSAVYFGTTKNLNLGGGSNDTSYSNVYPLGLDLVAYRNNSLKVNFKIDSNNVENIAAWLDADDDLTFENSEKVTELDDVAKNDSGSFYVNIPAGMPLGVHILRLRLANGTFNNNMDPCSLYADGQTIDIGVNVCPDLSPYCEMNGVSYLRYSVGSVFLKQISVGDSTINIDSTGVAFDYYSKLVVLQPGGFYSIHTVFGSYHPQGADTLIPLAWIDYDNDNTFSGAERVGDTTHIKKPGETDIISFTLPGNIRGYHRLRVALVDKNSGSIFAPYDDPCSPFQIVAGRDILLDITDNAGVDNLSAIQQSMQVLNNPGGNGGSQLVFNTVAGTGGNIVITDVSGRVLQSTSFSATNGQVRQTLQVAGISAGIYFVNVEQNGKIAACKKWVVE